MSKFLYADFLENKRTYNLAQGSWNRLLTSLLKEYEYTHTPYINQTQNGEKEYDGNPIFSAFIPEIKRAIRIIQIAPQEEGDDISAWLDDIALNAKAEKTAELVVDIKLSQASKRIAKDLIHKWILKQLDAAAIDEVLAAGTVV
jgi:hypothetical protein